MELKATLGYEREYYQDLLKSVSNLPGGVESGNNQKVCTPHGRLLKVSNLPGGVESSFLDTS